jgi:hypothetical protein
MVVASCALMRFREAESGVPRRKFVAATILTTQLVVAEDGWHSL